MITIMVTLTITLKGKDKDNDKNTSELKKWVYKSLKFDHIWSFGGKFEFLYAFLSDYIIIARFL